MLNFDYLKNIPELAPLHKLCDLCEQRQYTEPDSAAINARKALEWLVKAVYIMKGVEIPERAKLYELTVGDTFTDFIADPELMKAVHWIRKVGNLAAHDGKVTRSDAFYSTLNLYNLVGGVLLKLRVLDSLAPFDKTLLPTCQQRPRIIVTRADQTPEAFAAGIPAANVSAAPTVAPGISWDDISEADTRRRFIDLMLREAGWELVETEGEVVGGKACVEIEVDGMPNTTGKGYADYVLYGDNGKPLAVIEAKRTSKDPVVGKHQAELYADCLERKHGVRPVV